MINKIVFILVFLVASNHALACLVSENRFVSVANARGVFMDEARYFKEAYGVNALDRQIIDRDIVVDTTINNFASVPVSIDIPQAYRGWDLHILVRSRVGYRINGVLEQRPIFQQAARVRLDPGLSSYGARIRALSSGFTVYAVFVKNENESNMNVAVLRPFEASWQSCLGYIFVETQEEADRLFQEQEERIKCELGGGLGCIQSP